MTDVDDDQAARLEMVADECEELLRGQVEGDVGLAVRVDQDDVVATRGRIEPRSRVRRVRVEVRAAQVEELTADLRQRTVELYGVDPGLRKVVADLPGRRAGSIAEDRDGPRRSVSTRE